MLSTDMTYEDFKDLNGGIFADKVLHDKVFNIANDSKYVGYQTWTCFNGL